MTAARACKRMFRNGSFAWQASKRTTRRYSLTMVFGFPVCLVFLALVRLLVWGQKAKQKPIRHLFLFPFFLSLSYTMYSTCYMHHVCNLHRVVFLLSPAPHLLQQRPCQPAHCNASKPKERILAREREKMKKQHSYHTQPLSTCKLRLRHTSSPNCRS